MGKLVITNDDGPNSPGLRALIEGLRDLGELLVIVPEEALGGRGKAISLPRPIKVREAGDGFYTISGTPADAVLIALELSKPEPIDLVVSGINLGPNVGLEDFFHSGTVGAAIQASLKGIPALAISYAMGEGFPRPTEEQMEADLRIAAELASRLAKAILDLGMPEGTDIISVNVPIGADPSRIAITELLAIPFWEAVGGEGDFVVRPWPGRKPSGPRGTDMWALLNGYISITPIKLGLRYEKASLRAFLEEAGLPWA